ncbi:oligosaccharide flippase family protein [Thalassotalea euphylliae]|nr:oligosaccharide flippase family protein [Thalassotalea euphylliae]
MSDAAATRFGASIGWSIATRWGNKLIGFVNMIVLARLLSPEDFGIVAMATIFITILHSMTQVGAQLYVIRYPTEDVRVFNTGWTINLLQALLIALILCLSASYVADFYQEEVLRDIIYCLAAVKILKGLHNYGVYIAQKQLDFSLDFKITTTCRVAYSIATIATALWLKNYWAIVVGQAASAFVGLVLSYKLHVFRPRFEVYQWRKVLSFSKSMIPFSIGRFVNNQADIVAVSKLGSTEFLGQYNIASNLASLFTKELLMPVIKGILPNLTKLKASKDVDLKLIAIIGLAIYVFLPLGFGLALTSYEVIYVLLGEKWLGITDVMSWLSIYAMMSGITMFVSEQFLVIFDAEKTSNWLMWFRNALIVVALILAFYLGSYLDFPMAMALSSIIAFPVTLYFSAKAMNFAVWNLIRNWWPALLATAAMSFVITLISDMNSPVIFALLTKVLVGAITYVLVICILYYLRGLPLDTPEEVALNYIKRLNYTGR